MHFVNYRIPFNSTKCIFFWPWLNSEVRAFGSLGLTLRLFHETRPPPRSTCFFFLRRLEFHPREEIPTEIPCSLVRLGVAPRFRFELWQSAPEATLHSTLTDLNFSLAEMGNETELSNEAPKTVRVEKWYFGGCAGAMAACFTHPLDLLKVISLILIRSSFTGPRAALFRVQPLIRGFGILAIYVHPSLCGRWRIRIDARTEPIKPSSVCRILPLNRVVFQVVLQTKNHGAPGQKFGILQSTKNIYKSNGIIGFYNGLSASLLRQVSCRINRVKSFRSDPTSLFCSTFEFNWI